MSGLFMACSICLALDVHPHVRAVTIINGMAVCSDSHHLEVATVASDFEDAVQIARETVGTGIHAQTWRQR